MLKTSGMEYTFVTPAERFDVVALAIGGGLARIGVERKEDLRQMIKTNGLEEKKEELIFMANCGRGAYNYWLSESCRCYSLPEVGTTEVRWTVFTQERVGDVLYIGVSANEVGSLTTATLEGKWWKLRLFVPMVNDAEYRDKQYEDFMLAARRAEAREMSVYLE